MSNTGKLLEGFVQRIEELVLPHGFTISPREKVYNDDGVQIAEFDIEIAGKVGTADFKWLIECRDRPSEGPAPGSWIEQLVGRRNRFKFNKVIAVSTTGFAEGADQYAKESGIEIRTVTEADIDQISDWFLLNEMTLVKRGGILSNAVLYLGENEPKENQDALNQVLAKSKADAKLLLSTQTGQRITLPTAFSIAASSVDGLYDDISITGGSKKIDLQVSYPQNDSHFVVETERGNLRITEILFQGELTASIEKIPILDIQKYENIVSGEVIATTVSFNLDIEGQSREITFNKIEQTGNIHVVISAPKPAG